jgi:hypothetical protein
MTTMTFDTHAFIKNLVASGMHEKQAEALSQELKNIDTQNIATKGDIKDLELKIEQVKFDLIKWFVPMLLGQAALVVTLVKLL